MNEIDYINGKFKEIEKYLKDALESSNNLCDNRHSELVKDVKKAESNIQTFYSEVKSLVSKAKDAKKHLTLAMLEIKPYLEIDVLKERLDKLNEIEEKQRRKITLLQNKAERLKKEYGKLKFLQITPNGIINKILEQIDNIALLDIKEGTPEYQCRKTLMEAALEYRNINNKSILIKSKEQEDPYIGSFFFRSINELELTARSNNCLKAEGFEYIGDLVFYDNVNNNMRDSLRKNFFFLMKLINLGEKSYKEIIAALYRIGITEPIECEKYFKERIIICGSVFKNTFCK